MGLFQLLVLLSIQIIAAKSNFTKTGYFPVPVCPNNTQKWQASSRLLNCTDTYKYHCAPYRDLSQLYEFCYQRPLLEVKKGHCIGIAESGILIEINCAQYFAHGCPLEDYNSSQLYNYPNCLSILNGCYTEDCVCKCQSAREEIDTKTSKSDTSGQKTEPASCENQIGYLIAFVIICLIFLIISVALNVVQYRKQSGQGFICYTNPSLDEGLGLLNGQNHETQSQQRHTSGTQTTSCDEQGQNRETQLQQRHTSGTQTTSCDEQDGIYKLTLVDYTLEDAELFILLKRQCLHQAFREFLYLVNRALEVDKLYIFKQYDENGCILLHYAAQGGSTVILDCIIDKAPPDILQYSCIRGQNALHFAMKNNKTDMFMHLINKYKDKLPTGGAFAPVHWVAWQGDVWLLKILEQHKFDIFKKTKNGLNILDIACMTKLSKESDKFCEDVLTEYNVPNKIDPMKTDLSGWNIAHYASMSGRDLLLQFIEEKQTLRSLITQETKWKKTCLHIACEYANVSTVKFLVTKFPTQLSCKDHLSWNALHYAAKGGSLEILEYLIENELEIGCLTKDQKTILHVACIHKNLNISRYAVEHLSPELLNTATNTSGLLACHYLAVETKKDGKETNILEVLYNSDMNLKATCRSGLTLLEWAIDHLNIDLIEAVVSVKFREKCGVDTESLKKAITRKPDQTIILLLQTALNEMNEKK